MSIWIYFALIITVPLLAQLAVRRAYAKYSKVRSTSGMTGVQVARKILDDNGLHHVRIESISGKLSDHYDPSGKVVRLSEEIYHGSSLAAIAVAAHEVGHALQDQEEYAFLKIRAALVPVVNFGSNITWMVIIAGILLQMSGLLLVGIIFMAAAVVFNLVTLPVEFNASTRAMNLVMEHGFIKNEEERGTKKVLNAAALTYVAAAAVAVLELMRFVMIYLGQRD